MLKLQEFNTKAETGDSYSSLHQITASDKSKSAKKDEDGVCNKEKIKFYAEASDAIQQILEDASDVKSDKPRLKSIVNSSMR